MNKKISTLEDIYKYIQKTDNDCWIWLLGNSKRLPSYKIGGDKKRRPQEYFWKQKYGEFPTHDIWRICLTNRCVNPEHHIEYSSDLKRFMLKVDNTSSECWNWLGYKNNFGYGIFRMGCITVSAHRFSYHNFIDNNFPMKERNEQDEKIHILHSCDNPSCVNPEHLFIGTDYDNCLDRDMKGRHGTAKLSIDEVKEIKSLEHSNLSAKEISEKFNVSEEAIYSIFNNKRWKWVKKTNENRFLV